MYDENVENIDNNLTSGGQIEIILWKYVVVKGHHGCITELVFQNNRKLKNYLTLYRIKHQFLKDR